MQRYSSTPQMRKPRRSRRTVKSLKFAKLSLLKKKKNKIKRARRHRDGKVSAKLAAGTVAESESASRAKANE